jgi:LysR family transcriptional regulator, transcriptional activator for aaeXAB operon
MEYLNWDLDVLGRAVAFSNLSSASANIGVSQPQLSRIIAKLEGQFAVSLLNRDTKRKSTWTAEAHKLAEIYRTAFLDFRVAAQHLVAESEQVTIRMGALEGLIDIAMAICEQLFATTKSHLIELDVYDLPDLEEKYLGGHLDFIFTLREPGLKKPKYKKLLGYQTIDVHGASDGIQVLSLFEQANMKTSPGKKNATQALPNPKVFASNSLAVRERWIREFRGYGTLPSKIHPSKANSAHELPALLIAGEHISKALWGIAISAIGHPTTART